MYTLKTKTKKNVVIKDLGITVYWNDDNGTQIDEWLFDHSNSAKQVKRDLLITSDGKYKAPDKHVVESEADLQNIENPYDYMTVYVKNFNSSENPAMVVYCDNDWKIIGGSGKGGGAGFIHPKTHPATMITEDENHKFVKQEDINKWNNKSEFSGEYKDLKDKPEIYTKPEIDEKLKDINSFSGDYKDLKNKPEIYTKKEIDEKIKDIKISPPPIVSPSGHESSEHQQTISNLMVRYEAEGSNGDCIVFATGKGVKFEKTKNSCKLICPKDIQIFSCQIKFSAQDIKTTGNCLIDYGTIAEFNSSYDNLFIPQFQVMNNTEGSRAFKVLPFPAANLNTNAHTLQLTGLTGNIGIVVRLNF